MFSNNTFMLTTCFVPIRLGITEHCWWLQATIFQYQWLSARLQYLQWVSSIALSHRCVLWFPNKAFPLAAASQSEAMLENRSSLSCDFKRESCYIHCTYVVRYQCHVNEFVRCVLCRERPHLPWTQASVSEWGTRARLSSSVSPPCSMVCVARVAFGAAKATSQWWSHFCLFSYRQVSNISRTTFQQLKDSCTALRLSLPHPLKPDVKSRMM